MPRTHLSANVMAALPKSEMLSNMDCAITGSITLSWSWPASAAKVMVVSLPITLKQTWFTTSGITGFTLAGIIDEPACISGRLISFRPARGPEESRRRSLQILESFTAVRFRAPCTIT